MLTRVPASEIRLLVVDDHLALRQGLSEMLDAEPGMRCVGARADVRGLRRAIERDRPDVVVLDYVLGASDGLTTCFRIKQCPGPPGVVLYTAHAGTALAVPATIARVDAVVSKSAPVDELLSAMRRVAGGQSGPRPLSAEVFQAASARLDADDLPLAGMLAGAVPLDRAARLLGLSEDEVRTRALRILGRLQAGDRRARAPEEAEADGR